MKMPTLILDSCAVFELYRVGIWSLFLSRCEVTLVDKVVEEIESIDLRPNITAGRIVVVPVSDGDCNSFRARFDPALRGEMHLGESKSLCYLERNLSYCICSGDKSVFRALGLLGLEDNGMSLESILQRIGLGRSLRDDYSEDYRRKWTKYGQQDRVRGRGLQDV